MKNLTLTLFLLVFATVANSQQNTSVFNIKNFGAKGDSITNDTKAIQTAIDACTEAGGGKVWVPAGDYVIAPIHLKSNVTFSLDYGASLLGSQNIDDYKTDNMIPSREGNSECLIYAGNASNITLEGLGTIDGRGTPEAFPRFAGPGGKDNRPRLVRIENCKNVTFSGLTYRRPAFWGIHLVDCKKLHINGVKIDFRNNGANNDGLDIDGCEDVLVENCDINSGDDAICLKSSLNPCKDFIVRNCIVSSHTAPLKFGTSSSGGFINIKVENCYFYDCPMGAIKLQIVDGGTMENIDISRIKVVNGGSPIFIRLGNRGRIYTANTYTGTDNINGVKPEGAPVGSVKNIRISDVVAEVNFPDREQDKKASYKNADYKTEELTEREKAQAGPIMIAGIPGHYIENVTLENISISYPGEGTKAEANAVVAEDINRYPEQYFFGVLPAWGAYIRHAKNIQFKNVKMTSRKPDAREMIVLVNVDGFVNE
ncbi:glycoside hydrolase family 28 protein [Mangrovibacterium sp.]|uniref:glycoside hydrolase family 28 protein n=1 Tax=Mangrovibacterium sp. TaxID=1961364 RepID=UPI0035650799